MAGWRTHTGSAVALELDGIDTDQLIPARFMSTPRAAGYGRFLLHDLRFDSEGTALPAFPLNRTPNATVLVARGTFGSGSSREAAVYALVDFGIQVVVATSFGDIFASNAVNNGLLPACVETTDALIEVMREGDSVAEVDLEKQCLSVGAVVLPFEIDAIWREKLMNGWDDIDLTKTHANAIASFRAARQERAPWAFVAAQKTT